MCKLYHKGLSRILLLLLALCLALSSLSACRRPVDDTPAPEQQAAAPTTTVTPAPEVTPAPAPTPVPEPPYKGDGSKYTYIMADERDRQWEEDIVFFANAFLDFLHGHPKLSGRSVVTYERNYSSGRLLIQNSSEYTSFYDEALRNTFLEEVNLLILSIPTRSDKEIIISLQKIAALLHDAHTVVDTSTDSFLGIFAGPLHTQTGMVYGILMARKEYESLLMSRLDGINGVPIEEIMERLRPLVSYDCEIHYQDRACSYSYLSDPDVLRYIGVMGPEDMAVLSLTGLDGKAYEYTVRASSTKTWDWNDYVEYVSGTGNDSSDMGIYTCGASNFIIYGTEKYWYETLADGKAVYIRLNSCPSDEKTISFFEEAFSSVDPAELEKVIIDFRFNSGGDASLGGGFGKLLTLIKATDADVYVLINGTSMSAWTAIPALLKRYAPKVTLVGAPSGQGVRCFSYMSLNNSDALPNSGLLIYCYQMYSDSWPGYDEPTLMPDVEIEQTFEDYQNGIDSVLKYVLGQTEP